MCPTHSARCAAMDYPVSVIFADPDGLSIPAKLLTISD
jgi:hypothetical protein